MNSRIRKMLAIGVLAAASTAAVAQVGSWIPLTNQPTFQTDTALLLTDARVMVHEYQTANWWVLTPTKNAGGYKLAKWSKIASMPSNYCPLYFAAAVLPDGRVLIEGGEYNPCAGGETPLGAIYDPTTNTWTNVNPPSGWTQIGDSPAIVLPNGTFMLCDAFSTNQVLFDPSTLTWTSVAATGKSDIFSEEGLALLPNGTVLTVDTETGTNSETYNPGTGVWSSAGSTINVLPNDGGMGIVPEMGPLVQRPDGSVVAFGATQHMSVYDSSTGTWTAGPDNPSGYFVADGPASILTNGNVLAPTSPFFAGPTQFYEFDGTNLNAAPATASSTSLPSYNIRLLPLPTGQVLYTVADGGTIDVELYTPATGPQNAWRPTFVSYPSTVTRGMSYKLKGRQFNGLSAGAAYGDDVQDATNYPLLQIKNNATGHIFWVRTHDHSSMGIATGNTVVSTTFDVPATIETGASTIHVVANGIFSVGKTITIN